MPRPIPKPEKRRFKAGARAWSSKGVAVRLGVLLGSDERLLQRISTTGRNASALLSLNDQACLAALREASAVLGTYRRAHASFDSLPKKQGRPEDRALLAAIRHLRKIFAARYVGKRVGRTKNELAFIEICLEDARLVKRGFKGTRYLLRSHPWVSAAGRGAQGRHDAIEKIAAAYEKIRPR